jgi:hypothetical protein
LITSGDASAGQTFTWDGSGLGGGTHTIALSGRDAAGNTSETSLAVSLVVPTAVPPPPTDSSRGWAPVMPTAVPTVTPSASPTATRASRPTRTPEAVPFGGVPAAPLGEGGPEAVVNPPSETLGSAQPTVPGSSSGVLWGGAALALIAGATAVALEQARRRREEEARIAAEMRRRNAEAEAREQAELAALAAAKAEAEYRLTAGQILQQATGGQEPSSEWLAAAAVTAEATRRAWQERIERREQRLEEQEIAAREMAEEDARRQRGAEEEARRRAAALAQADRLRQIAEGRDTVQLAEPPPRPWWERALDWAQDGIEHFVWQPPAWLSLSYQGQVPPFSLRNYTLDEWVTYQPMASNFLESITYQRVSLRGSTTYRITSNPSGRLDVNFANGRVTFRGAPRDDGSRVDWYVQPGSLGFGRVVLMGPETTPFGETQRVIQVTTFDIDLLGRNWASIRMSQALGRSVSTRHCLGQAEFDSSRTELLEVQMGVHRYPRILVAAGTVVIVVEAGIGLLPVLAPAIPVVERLRPVFGLP